LNLHFEYLKGDKKMKQNEYRQDVAFVNRKNELTVLEAYINKRPSEILFLYGPKSSGKTTLLYKFIESAKKTDKLEVKFFNLRKVYLGNYTDFLKVFFGIDYSKSKNDVKEIREYNVGLFKETVEVLKGIENKEVDPFKVLEKQLINFNKNKKKTIIIIDELQALQDLYMNGERQLIKELFNFFVAMTKESHLAHIIISSSDGYFIDTVCNDSKLRKTSDFYEIDYLSQADVWEWLTNLKKYSKIINYTLTEKEIQMFWDTLGGSVWEIQYLLSKRFGNNTKTICEVYLKKIQSMIKEYIKLSDAKKEVLSNFYNKRNIEYRDFKKMNISDIEIENILADMVHNNILYFDPVNATFNPQGRSTELGINLYFDELKK
jgi:uncharacterized protein